MGLFDSLPPPSKAPADQTAEAAGKQPADGLFGSLPPPSKPAADPAAGKRPAEGSSAAEPAADSSSKRARSDAGELASTGSGLLASAGSTSGGSLGAPQPRCTRLEAACSEDAGSRLTMEGERSERRALPGLQRSRRQWHRSTVGDWAPNRLPTQPTVPPHSQTWP